VRGVLDMRKMRADEGESFDRINRIYRIGKAGGSRERGKRN
jgi:hypothetical protein